jgi:predicted dehydrogenase
MNQGKLRWGILGTANIGRAAVIPAIQSSINGEVVAVGSRSLEKASEFAARAGIPQAWGSYEEMLAANDIDAVYIPLPNSLHREWAVRAAQAGKHILCEKPLALNAAEVAEMQAAADAANVLLMEAFMYRFHPQTQRVQELVRRGEIGDLRMIRAGFTFKLTDPSNIRYRADLGGGSLMDVGCYCVNFIRTIADEEPVSVQAQADWASSGVDSQMTGMLQFASGLMGLFDCGLNQERREEYVISGTEGWLSSDRAFLPGIDAVQIQERHGRRETILRTLSGVDEYRLMVEEFAACVQNSLSLRYPSSEAAANLRVIEALYRSARNHGSMEVV